MIDTIEQKIRDEVKKRRALKDKKTVYKKEDEKNISASLHQSKLYDFAKKIAKLLQKVGLYKLVNFVRINSNINKFNKIYTMSQFTMYHDENFIDNLYTVLLNKDATNDEKSYYLENLRNGTLSKSQIIIELYYSKEGRKQNIVILGAKKRLILFSLYKLPVVGYLIKLFITIATLPKLIKRINQNEIFIHNINETKIDNNTIVHVQKDIENKFNNVEKRCNDFDKQFEVPKLEESVEIDAMDFLEDAISKFPYSKENFKDFDKDDLYYSLFESTFYNHEVVLKKQAVYLEYIPSINNKDFLHLDIGCGRGEFLTLLKNNGFESMGIDINNLEVQELKKQHFNVEHIDMIKYLKTTNKIFSSISALQVIEHIDYDTLKKFIALAYEKLETNGVIILETINPHNKVAFNSFYMDETHKRPLPPEMVAFMLQYMGFKNIKFRYTSPMPSEFVSKEYDNINYHDYAVIGYKI